MLNMNLINKQGFNLETLNLKKKDIKYEPTGEKKTILKKKH